VWEGGAITTTTTSVNVEAELSPSVLIFLPSFFSVFFFQFLFFFLFTFLLVFHFFLLFLKGERRMLNSFNG
jgi:hypothetical protein